MTLAAVKAKIDRWMQDDDLFFAELEKGYRFEKLLLGKLRGEGIPAVHVTDIPRQWERAARRAYLAQYGDIAVPDLDGIHLEVKSRNIRFTCSQDFPYPSVFVDGEGSRGLKAVPEDRIVYVLVSQITGAVVWVPPGTPTTTRRIWDRVRDIPVLIHEVPKSVLRSYEELVDFLRAF